MSIVIDKRGEFPKKPFRPLATKAWNEFFRIVTADTDIAHWNVHADSGVVQLSARQTTVDEEGPEWEPPPPIAVVVDGIVERLTEVPQRHTDEELHEHFSKWAERGILEAFRSATISKKFERFNPEGNSFAIVSAPLDLGLAEDDLSLLWSNDKKLTVATIKRRQRDAQKRTKKHGPRVKAVKKKKRRS